jgi:3-oxoacyl-[acyl-carrier protein] reductase
LNRHDLAGRQAVVTGGAGGIGLACARRLAADGARVALWDLDRAAVEAAAATIGNARARVVDVTDADAVEAAAAADAPAIVVHAAGILGPVANLWETDPDAFRRVIEVNLTGAFLVARAAARAMRAAAAGARDGRIVLISSIQGKEGMARGGAYVAAKAGVDALVKALARELATGGIRVNAIAPAAAETAMARELTPERRADILGRIPLGRFVRVDEIAASVAWLCSPECSFTTGAVFDMSGGRSSY